MKHNAGNRSPNRYKGGAPTKPYIERRGEIAVKISPATRTAIEIISIRRQIDPRDLIAQLVEETRREELDAA